MNAPVLPSRHDPARRLRNSMTAAGVVLLALAAATPFAAHSPAALAAPAEIAGTTGADAPALRIEIDAGAIKDAAADAADAADSALRDEAAAPARQVRRAGPTLAMPYFSFSRS